jgi:hypothetical protein
MIVLFMMLAALASANELSIETVIVYAYDDLCATSNGINIASPPIAVVHPAQRNIPVRHFAIFRKFAFLVGLHPPASVAQVSSVSIRGNIHTTLVDSDENRFDKNLTLFANREHWTPLLSAVNKTDTKFFSSCGTGGWDFAEKFFNGRAGMQNNVTITYEVDVKGASASALVLPTSKSGSAQFDLAEPFTSAALPLNSTSINAIYVSSVNYTRVVCATDAVINSGVRSVFFRDAVGVHDCTIRGSCRRFPFNFYNSSATGSPVPPMSPDLNGGDLVIGSYGGPISLVLAQQQSDMVWVSTNLPLCESENMTAGGNLLNATNRGHLVVGDRLRNGIVTPTLSAPFASFVTLPPANTSASWTSWSNGTDRPQQLNAVVPLLTSANKRVLLTHSGIDAIFNVFDDGKQLAVGMAAISLMQWSRVLVFDCNNDGLFDMLLLSTGDKLPKLLVNKVDTPTSYSFALSNASLGSIWFKSASAIDLNGDGMPDLLTTHENGTYPVVFINVGSRGAAQCEFRPMSRSLSATENVGAGVAHVSDAIGEDHIPEWLGADSSASSLAIDPDATGLVTVRVTGDRYARVRVTLPRVADDSLALYSHTYVDAWNHRDDQASIAVPRNQRFDLSIKVMPGDESFEFCSLTLARLNTSALRLFDVIPLAHPHGVDGFEPRRSALAAIRDDRHVEHLLAGEMFALERLASFDPASFFPEDLLQLTVNSTCFEGELKFAPTTAAGLFAALSTPRKVVSTLGFTGDEIIRTCRVAIEINYNATERGCSRAWSISRNIPWTPTLSTGAIGTGGTSAIADVVTNSDGVPIERDDGGVPAWQIGIGVAAGLLLLIAVGVVAWTLATRGSAQASAAKAKLRNDGGESGTSMASVTPSSEYGAFPPEKPAYGKSKFSNLS